MSDSSKNKFGIATAHAYSVLSTLKLKAGGGKTERIYMVRDPWGSTGYGGKWSKGDIGWTEELRR